MAPQMNGGAGPSTGRGGRRQEGADLDGMNDVMAAGGINLADEEEEIRRAAAQARREAGLNQGQARDPVLLNRDVLQKKIVAIGASPFSCRLTRTAGQYQLKFLEPDTIPMIAIAAQQRLKGLLESMMAARDHRLLSAPDAPPPMHAFDATGQPLVEGAPMWDEVIYDNVEKVLATYERVEREHERTERISRAARDEREREEQQMRAAAEALKTEASSDAGEGTDGQPPKKKQKKSTAAQAKNTPEDVQKRLGDATARQMLGGNQKRYSWLTSGAGAEKPSPPASAAGSPKTTAVGQPAASTSAPLPKSKLGMAGADLPPPASSDRLSLYTTPHATVTTDPNVVTWADARFAFEHERGTGAGIGSGTKSLYSALARHRS